MKIMIIGDGGTFGSFLKAELSALSGVVMTTNTVEADYIILSVPSSAFDDAARHIRGKHLVNVCSVQDAATKTCLKYSTRVTGIHPMFGPNSPRSGRTCIVTYASEGSDEIINLFSRFCGEIVTEANGKVISGKMHDEMMRKTHLPVLMFGELAALIVEQAADVPDNCLPTSFKRLKALADQMKDMSPGTVESIRSNRGH
jgi:prephenate dehydrogenase